MPGWSNSDNKFGPTKYVVGTTLGDGCNYTLFSDAIADIIADGGTATLLVQNGTYTEDITFTSAGVLNLNIIAVGVDGQLSGGVAPVNIVGNHTVGGNGLTILQIDNIAFQSAAASPIFSVSPTAGAIGVGLKYCSLTNAGGHGFDVAATAATQTTISTAECRVTVSGEFINTSGAGVVQGQHFDTGILSSNTMVTAAAITSMQFFNCAGTSSTSCFVTSAVAGGFTLREGFYSAPDEILIGAALGHEMRDVTLQSSAASGFFITGTGSIQYSDIVNLSTAIDIDPAMTISTIGDWKPYGEAVAGPAPALGAIRGTACFDSSQFTVTQGFVQITGAAGLTWTDQGAPITVASNSGSFSTAAVALTLPAAPSQGDVCKFKVDSAGILTITANAGQTIRVGAAVSAVAGTCASTLQGDAIELTYRAATATWIANAVIGNFNVT